MKKLLISFLAICNCGITFSQSLKIIYGDRLVYFDNRGEHLIKQLEARQIFQGYDIIDSTHVFFAYTGLDAEASTFLAVYDIRKRKEYLLFREIGGTGESFFHYNHENGLVVCNWSDGIYTFEPDLRDLGSQPPKEFKPKLIMECKGCVTAFWIDQETIGYQVPENGKYVNKYYKLAK